ncbi:ankyrin repeat-containing domain protein [Podospora australis]|uniref:protein S-acyltransferase n=1 Tax=Podospora australis TaxID=1536484 RepID=A0AAN7AHH8_9PEZI|nr:ankyrin repeat-containing domain protein [Podospora australis]
MDSDTPAKRPHRPPQGRHEFGIGIMCALTLEATAVGQLFDETWKVNQFFPGHHSTSTTYSTGRIGDHKVVLVHLRNMSKNASSAAATDLARDFYNIKLVLVVGICGGAPLLYGKQRAVAEEQFLGDVVISEGIFQYDYGRQLPGDFLPKINTLATGAIMQEKLTGSVYPGRQFDTLFHSDYLHKHHEPEECEKCAQGADSVCVTSMEKTCDVLKCSLDHLVVRSRLEDQTQPFVHYGAFASGDRVMRDGHHRDELAARDKVVAFEMEGTSVWETFPNCLVIKSICDYSDSHKNKKSQAYAAATAAAGARAFLEEWPVYVPEPRRVALSPENMILLDKLQTSPYRDRKDRNPDRIKDPGCGKSVLAKYLVDHVVPSDNTGTTCYFFFKDDFEDQKTVTSALSCILHQLFKRKPELFSDEVRNRLVADAKKFTESFDDLWDVLIEAAQDQEAGDIVCIFDALDDAKKLRDRGGLSVIHLSGSTDEEMEQISQEIRIFIEHRVQGLSSLLRLEDHEEKFILGKLLAVPHRTYLWVYLTLDLLESKANIDNVGLMQALFELPHSVDEAYERILSSSSDQEETKKILQIILAAERPLTVTEMNFALAIREDHRSYQESALAPKERLVDYLRQVCGLFITINHSKVYLLHQTAREFLIRNESAADSDKEATGLTWKHSVDLVEAHHHLAKICAWHLLFPDVNVKTKEEDYEKRLAESDNFPFLGYSAFCRPLLWYLTFHRDYTQPGKPLTIAACLGLVGLVKYFLKADDCKIENRDLLERTALAWAAVRGFPDVVRVLIKGRGGLFRGFARLSSSHKGAFVDAEDNRGRTPLLMCCQGLGEYASPAVIAALVENGANIEARDHRYDNHTPLIAACVGGSEAVVRVLLEHGADPNVRSSERSIRLEDTPLAKAVERGRMDIVKVLLEHDADIEKGRRRGTPLALACETQNEPMISLLLDKGANIHQLSDGHTALHIALCHGRNRTLPVPKYLLDRSSIMNFTGGYREVLPAVQLLLDRGADINGQCIDGTTALYYYCRESFPKANCEEVVTFLLDHGAGMENCTTDGESALDAAAAANNFALVQLLIGRSANLHNRNAEGWTPLAHAAAIYHHPRMIQFLTDQGADVNVRAYRGRSPLSLCISSLSLKEVAEVLLDNGAVVDKRDDDGRTPLSWAVDNNGHLGVAELLLERGTDPNSTDNEGRSVMSWAAGSEHGRDLAELLIKYGARVDTEDERFLSPLFWALHMGSPEFVAVLRENRAPEMEYPLQKGYTERRQAEADVRLALAKLQVGGDEEASQTADLKIDDSDDETRVDVDVYEVEVK